MTEHRQLTPEEYQHGFNSISSLPAEGFAAILKHTVESHLKAIDDGEETVVDQYLRHTRALSQGEVRIEDLVSELPERPDPPGWDREKEGRPFPYPSLDEANRIIQAGYELLTQPKRRRRQRRTFPPRPFFDRPRHDGC